MAKSSKKLKIGHVQDTPVSTSMISNECMICHMKVHIVSYNLDQKKFSKSKIHILPNYEQTNLKTAIVLYPNLRKEVQEKIHLSVYVFWKPWSIKLSLLQIDNRNHHFHDFCNSLCPILIQKHTMWRRRAMNIFNYTFNSGNYDPINLVYL